MANGTPRLLYPRERDSVPILLEAGQAPGPVWTEVENLAPTGFRSPDRPASSKSIPTTLPRPTKSNLVLKKYKVLQNYSVNQSELRQYTFHRLKPHTNANGSLMLKSTNRVTRVPV
jgi:hypothetical protein